MSAAQLIEGVLNGTIKVADIDPSLQWGALGAGVGGAGGLVKSLASGDDLKKVLMSTLGGAALGGGVGLSGAVGAQILGAKPPQVSGLLKPKKEYRGDFGSATGTGLIGAGGLMAGGMAEGKRDINETLRNLIGQADLKGQDLFEGQDARSLSPNKKLDDLLKNKLKAPVPHPKPGGPTTRSLTADEIKAYLSADDPHQQRLTDLLDEARVAAKPPAAGAPPDVGKGLLGKSDMVDKFLAHLQGVAEKDSARSGAAKQLLRKLMSPELQKVDRLKPTPRATEFLKKFTGAKGVKNLALAAGGIGLGTYGLTGLGERIWGKKD